MLKLACGIHAEIVGMMRKELQTKKTDENEEKVCM